VLELLDVCVHYGTTEAVKSVDLTVDGTETVALLGPNGAGKSSLLRAISQVIPYTGTVLFDGADLRRRTAFDVARMGLIHVPEGRRIFPTLTVHENLLSGLTAARSRRGKKSVDAVYDLFPNLALMRSRQGYALSGGEQQMVAIGRALVGAPRMLLLDEPSLGLAPIIVETVFNALRDLKGQIPILLVEQNTSLALTECDRAYLLVTGEIKSNATSAEFADRGSLLASFLGRESHLSSSAGSNEHAMTSQMNDTTSGSPKELGTSREMGPTGYCVVESIERRAN